SLTSRGAHQDDAAPFWNGFGFAPKGAEVGTIVARVLDEGVTGFYAPDEKTLYIRRDEGLAAKRSTTAKQTLVPEIEHALQDQAFGMRTTAANDDEALAQLALYEGDATLTMIAYEAATTPDYEEHWASRVAHKIKTMGLEQIIRMGQHSKELLAAP